MHRWPHSSLIVAWIIKAVKAVGLHSTGFCLRPYMWECFYNSDTSADCKSLKQHSGNWWLCVLNSISSFNPSCLSRCHGDFWRSSSWPHRLIWTLSLSDSHHWVCSWKQGPMNQGEYDLRTYFSCESFEQALLVNLVLSERARGGRYHLSRGHCVQKGPQGQALDAPFGDYPKMHCIVYGGRQCGTWPLYLLPYSQ